MKLKEFKIAVEDITLARKEFYNAYNNNNGEYTNEIRDLETLYNNKANVLERDCKMVNLEYTLQYNTHYAKAFKVGTKYFNKHYDLLSEGKGYFIKAELPKITDEMLLELQNINGGYFKD